MKVGAASVIEIDNDDLQTIQSFSDDPEGQTQAENLFADLAKQHGAQEGELEGFTEEGYYETGTYQVFLAYSYGGKQDG